jgi:hypothetical protein
MDIPVDVAVNRTAKQAFQGDLHLIAEEPEVTRSVVHDYQGLVLAGLLSR